MTESQSSPDRSSSLKLLPRIGPGLLVTAAFIGPGTVTAASTAGFDFGLTLLWVVGLSTVAAIVLQEMAGRIGLVKRQPLGQVLRQATPAGPLRWILSGLIFLAILFGNTAYQSGNIAGALQGIDLLFDGEVASSKGLGVLVLTLLTLVASGLLISGNPKLVSRCLVGLVIVMSLLFIGIAIQVSPSFGEVARHLWPRIPTAGGTTTMALFGTTIVPYNLFLYASLVNDRWSSDRPTHQSIYESRWDIALAVGLGGIVTGAILLTGAAAQHSEVKFSFAELPGQLEAFVAPQVSRVILGLGLLGAGLTSAITAPLAAGYAAAGIFGWTTELRAKQNRVVLGVVLAAGWIVAAAGILWGVKPEVAIILAQAANGLILPIIAMLLWWLVTRRSIMGQFVNGPIAQVLGLLIVGSISTIWLINVGSALWKKLFG